MALGIGIKSRIQWGLESTWATAPTVNRAAGFESQTIDPVIGMARDPNMPGPAPGGTQPWLQSEITPIGEKAEGQISMVLDYEGLLRFFDLIFGTGTFGTYGVTVTGTNPYTHVFSPHEFLNSLTMELLEGGIPVGQCQQLLGVKSKGLTVKATAASGEQGFLRLTNDLVAQQKKYGQTPTNSLNPVPRIPVLMTHATAVNDGSGDSASIVRLRDFEFQMQRKILDSRWALGLAFIDEPVADGYITATMKIVREYTSISLPTALKAGTTGQPAVTFSDGNGRSVTFQLERGKVIESKLGISNAGVLTQTTTWEGTWAPGGTFGVEVVFVNTQNAAAV